MLKLYNSLTRKIEEFKPLNPPKVGLYTCGPTVYDYFSIGNYRTFIFSDVLVRVLRYNGYKVKYIMNITDVGHLTGDNLGDSSVGEDRLEKASKRERKTAWEVAEFYTKAFLDDWQKLNLIEPTVRPKATEHIKEQINLVRQLKIKGFTYKTSDGIYFDTLKFKNYGKLSPMEIGGIREGARVALNPEKKNPADFALWKFSPKGESRDMEWESPWGRGFPGWHIECSAMSMEYLGETFDIHAGGEDLAATHHPNEIAQSEAATGKQFVKYWLHGAFITVEGKRMGRSEGNVYRLSDVEKRGFSPLDLRYLFLTGHYRQKMNFTWKALGGAKAAREKLMNVVAGLVPATGSADYQSASKEPTDSRHYKKAPTRLRQGFDGQARGATTPLIGCAEYEGNFLEAINNDLNMPKALAVMWDLVKSNYPPSAKMASLLKFDKVLGLKLDDITILPASPAGGRYYDIKKLPKEVKKIVKEREKLRKEEKWLEADKLRRKIEKAGYRVEDTKEGAKIVSKIPNF